MASASVDVLHYGPPLLRGEGKGLSYRKGLFIGAVCLVFVIGSIPLGHSTAQAAEAPLCNPSLQAVTSGLGDPRRSAVRVDDRMWFADGIFDTTGQRVGDAPEFELVNSMPGPRLQNAYEVDGSYVAVSVSDRESLTIKLDLYDKDGSYVMTLDDELRSGVFYGSEVMLIQGRDWTGPGDIVEIFTYSGTRLGQHAVKGSLGPWAVERDGKIYLHLSLDRSTGAGAIGILDASTGELLGYLPGLESGLVESLTPHSYGDYIYVTNRYTGHADMTGKVAVYSSEGSLLRIVERDSIIWGFGANEHHMWFETSTNTFDNTLIGRSTYFGQPDGTNVVSGDELFADDPDVSALDEGDGIMFGFDGFLYGFDHDWEPPGEDSNSATVVLDGRGAELARFDTDDFGAPFTVVGDLLHGLRDNTLLFYTRGMAEVFSLDMGQFASGEFSPLGSYVHEDTMWVTARDTDSSGRWVGLLFTLALNCGFDGTFADDDGSIFESDTEWLAAQAITRGCNEAGNLFCMDDFVTRGQMAAFLFRALNLPGVGSSPFVDVTGSGFETEIAAVAEAGITLGCNPDGTLFCPDDFVNRGQMAAFLSRGLNLTGGSANVFIDVEGSIFEDDISMIADAGITKGCNPEGTSFCPDDLVTRGQMAAFLHRAIGDG